MRSQNIGWAELLLDEVVFIDEQTHATFLATELKYSDVLLNITGASIGRSAVVDERIVGGNVNQHVCIIRTNSDELDAHYLSEYLVSDYGQIQIDEFQAGGNRQGLNFAQIRSFAIPIPPAPKEQQTIADVLRASNDLITAQASKVDLLKTHKRGLIQGLFLSQEQVAS